MSHSQESVMFKTLLATMMVASFATNALAEGDGSARVSCSVWTAAVQKALFFNTGTYATKGSALFVIPECVDGKSGVYGNLFLLAPFKEFDTGKEIDVRVGQRGSVGGMAYDLSVANYAFWIGPGISMFDTTDLRLRVSKTLTMVDVSMEPFGIFDYQRGVKPTKASQTAFAGGIALNTKLGWARGTPNFAITVTDWKVTQTSLAPVAATVFSIEASLGYSLGHGITAGPRVLQTHGSLLSTSRQPETVVGVFAYAAF